MSNAQVEATMDILCEAVDSELAGCGKVATVAYDGAHRMLRGKTGDADAKIATNAVLTAMEAQNINGNGSLAQAQKTVVLSYYIQQNIAYESPCPSVAGSFLAKPKDMQLAAEEEMEEAGEEEEYTLNKPGYLKGRYFTENIEGAQYTADVAAWLPSLKVYLVRYNDGDSAEKSAEEIEALMAEMEDISLSWSARQQLQATAQAVESSRSTMSSDDALIQFPLAVQQSYYSPQRKVSQIALRGTFNDRFIIAPSSAPAALPCTLEEEAPPMPITDFKSLYGPGCHVNNLPDHLKPLIKALNEAIPRPLLRPKEEHVPRSALRGADNKVRLPAFLDHRFLSVIQKEQLVTINRNFCAAKNYILWCKLQEHAKKNSLKALRDLSVFKLKAILNENGYPVNSRDASKPLGVQLYERAEDLATAAQEVQLVISLRVLEPVLFEGFSILVTSYLQPARSSELITMLLLDQSIDKSVDYFSPEIKVAVLGAAASNVKLAIMRKDASTKGLFYDAEGRLVHQVDFSHLHHNMWQSSIKQPLDQLGEGFSSTESVLPLARLLEAALRTEDPILINGLQGNCDMHSHAMSRACLTSMSLVRELEALGYKREAIIIKILGQSIEAWSMPHQTEVTRSEALHLVTLLVYRLFGDGLRSTQCLGRAFFGGLPLKQWLDLVSNADARMQFLRSVASPLRSIIVESASGTGSCESRFSMEASCNHSGHKASALTIQQRAPQLDVAMQFKLGAQEDDSAFNTRVSKRQRKDGERKRVTWNDGTFERKAYDKDLQTRAQQHNGGHNNHTTRDFVKRRTGF